MGKQVKPSGSLKPAQAKVALSKTTYHPLINQAVLKAVSKTVTAIDKILIGERKLSVNLVSLLAKLKDELSTHLKKTGNSPSDFQVKTAFHNSFCKVLPTGKSICCSFAKERIVVHG